MFSRSVLCRFAMLLCLVGCPAIVRADDDGQASLDKATEAKLNANSMEDLAEVIRLCRSALRLGLDDENTKFATEMLAGTLTQRAEVICSEIFDRPVPPARWPELRRVALFDLEESVKLDANQADAHYMLGRLNALPGGDRRAAEASIDEAIRLSEKEPALKSKALMIRGNLKTDEMERLADYTQAVKLAPSNADAVRGRGLFYLSQDKCEAAIIDLDKAIQLDPKNPDAYEAKGVAQIMLKDYDDALITLKQASELSPDAPMPYAHRGRVYALQGKNEEALDELQKALELEPRAVEILLLRSRVYQQAGKTEKALADVNRVLRLSPGLEEALKLHAMLSAGSGKLQQAINDLQQLNTAAPDNVDLIIQLGLFYAADKQPEKAVETFNDAIEKDPKSFLAYRSRADSYLSLGRQTDALADYEAALKLQPEDSGVLNNLAWLLATSTEAKLRDGKRAIELATQSCKLTEYKQAHILSTLAASYAETGDFNTAIEWSTKAVGLGKGAAMKEQLEKELASYKEKKPWREETPPVLAADETESEDGKSEATPETPATSDSGAKDDSTDTASALKPTGDKVDRSDSNRR